MTVYSGLKAVLLRQKSGFFIYEEIAAYLEKSAKGGKIKKGCHVDNLFFLIFISKKTHISVFFNL